jgi:hypothetical protein
MPSYHRTAAQEITETLLTSFYELEQTAHRELGVVEGRGFVTWWISKMREAASLLQGLKFDDWRAKK